MEFNEKLQELRKQTGLTQEELAAKLYVSRTAISKWESGRGYPNIDSLKAIGNFFGITIDQLLSGDELLTLAEEDTKKKTSHFRDLVFGLLDCCAALFFFLPFFGQMDHGAIQEVSLLALTAPQPWLRVSYYVAVGAMILFGIFTLAMQNCENTLWARYKVTVSLLLNAVAILLFTLSRQPYGAVFVFVFLMIKVLMLLKKV